MINAPFWTSNSYKQFQSLALKCRRPLLFQTLSFRRKITYRLLLIGCFEKVIPAQDVGHMIHLNAAQQLP